MNIILWIIFGGLAGWLASIFVGGEEGMGIIANVLVGIVGAFIGGWVSNLISGGEDDAERPTSITGFLWAVLGAVVLLALLNLIF